MVPAAGAALCFTLSVTDEVELVRDRVARFTRVFPGCRIVLLPDGREACRLPWPAGPRVSLRPSRDSLYAVGNGGLVVERHLEAFLDSGAEWWFKIDPDTVPWHRFRSLPRGPRFFGTLQGGSAWPALQGGCIGGTRAAARALLASGALRSPDLRHPNRSWATGNPHLLRRAGGGLVSFDFVHAWACRTADIAVVAHDEIRSEWREPPRDPWRFAITHPHKSLDVRAELDAANARHAVAGRLVELLEDRLPAGVSVAVASKGDTRLLALGGRVGRHFPADATGAWAGFHPASSEDAIALLEAERADGVGYFALPETGEWWLDYYGGLARHLAQRYELLAHVPGAGRVWSLEERS